MIKIKNYYCPHCKRFRSYFQLSDFCDCKYCGNTCLNVARSLGSILERENSHDLMTILNKDLEIKTLKQDTRDMQEQIDEIVDSLNELAAEVHRRM